LDIAKLFFECTENFLNRTLEGVDLREDVECDEYVRLYLDHQEGKFLIEYHSFLPDPQKHNVEKLEVSAKDSKLYFDFLKLWIAYFREII